MECKCLAEGVVFAVFGASDEEINRAVGVVGLDVARVGIHESNVLVTLLGDGKVTDCGDLSRYWVGGSG